MFVFLGVVWLCGVFATGLLLALPSAVHESQSAKPSTLQTLAIVLLWPATVVMLLIGVNKFVRDEYGT